MSSIVFFALLLLITLLGCYLVIENNRRKAIEAKKKCFNNRVKEVNYHFKNEMIRLSEEKIIRPKHVDRLVMICNNFFVVQAQNEENLAKLEHIIDLLTNTINTELNSAQLTNDQSSLSDRMQYFISELPHHGIAYNKIFYTEILPSLITSIKYQAQVDSELEHTPPCDDSHIDKSNPKSIEAELN
ncbi:hypothetical protein [Pseudoalteromonas mariniglutinosa]|uniref:hypothetical protein n=1 Tax=Pseudoalteromonas mariniglutinosa TaxID=206042 RepID=UPI00385083D7